jgi:hypothetical protein
MKYIAYKKYIVVIGVRAQANHVAVQSPSADLARSLLTIESHTSQAL